MWVETGLWTIYQRNLEENGNFNTYLILFFVLLYLQACYIFKKRDKESEVAERHVEPSRYIVIRNFTDAFFWPVQCGHGSCGLAYRHYMCSFCSDTEFETECSVVLILVRSVLDGDSYWPFLICPLTQNTWAVPGKGFPNWWRLFSGGSW